MYCDVNICFYLQKCLSKSAITFQLELKPLSYHAMFYKYVLYKIRVVNKKDLMSIPNNILPASSSDDDNVSYNFFSLP